MKTVNKAFRKTVDDMKKIAIISFVTLIALTSVAIFCVVIGFIFTMNIHIFWKLILGLMFSVGVLFVTSLFGLND